MSKNDKNSKVSKISDENKKEQFDSNVKSAIIGAVALIATTLISALVAPVVLQKMNVTPSATPQVLNTHTPIAIEATSTLQTTSTPENLIYANDFSNGNGGFPIGDTVDESRTMKQSVINGEYHWENLNYGTFLSKLIPDGLPILSNFEVSVDAKIEGDNIGENVSFGLMVRNNKDKYYYFGIRPTSTVYLMAVVETIDGKQEWTHFDGDGKTFSAIKQEGFNNIKIIANNERLSFYVNNQLLADIFDDKIKSGSIGVMIYSYKDVPTTFIIDNFQVRQLP